MQGIQLDTLISITLFKSLIDIGILVIHLLGTTKERQRVIFARLDRALANHHGINLYHNTTITNLSIIGLDHAPILLSLSPSIPYVTYNSFKFEAKWLLIMNILI